MPKVYITRAIPKLAIEALAELFEVVVNPLSLSPDIAEIRKELADADALICLLTDIIDRETMLCAPKLKVIANYAVGYNNIDLVAAKDMGIRICNTPGVLTESTADLAWALLMACGRRIVEADQFMRSGASWEWDPMLYLGKDIHGKTLGIIGMGRIGSAVAKRAIGFDMRILYSGSPKELSFAAENSSLEELLCQSDYISIHAPLKPETIHLIGENELKKMKPGAILINTARGAIVDEAALVKALRDGHPAAAGLDVFENEPDLYPGLRELPNVVILPHIGSASIETRTAMAMLTAQNVIAVLGGQKPPAELIF